MSALSNGIREVREGLGLSHSEFAKKISTTTLNVILWEYGIRKPRPVKILTMHEVTGLPIGRFLYGKDLYYTVATPLDLYKMGIRIFDRRVNCGISRPEFTGLIHKTETWLIDVERGETILDDLTVMYMAYHLKVSASYLRYGVK